MHAQEMYRLAFLLIMQLAIMYLRPEYTHLQLLHGICELIFYILPDLRLSNGNTFCPNNICFVPAFSLRVTRMITANNTKHYRPNEHTEIVKK